MLAIIATTEMTMMLNTTDALTFAPVLTLTLASEVLLRVDKVDNVGPDKPRCHHRHEILTTLMLMRLITPTPGEIGCDLQPSQLLAGVLPLELRQRIVPDEECRAHILWMKRRMYTTLRCTTRQSCDGARDNLMMTLDGVSPFLHPQSCRTRTHMHLKDLSDLGRLQAHRSRMES